MSTVTTVGDLSTFMNVTLDTPRAQLMLDLVESFALSIVAPLPASARGVVLTAAARAYPNPSGVTSESTAGSSTSFGWHGAGGAYLTLSERSMLRRLAGKGGGAFSVNPAPAAGQCYRDPLRFPLDQQETFALDQDLP